MNYNKLDDAVKELEKGKQIFRLELSALALLIN